MFLNFMNLLYILLFQIFIETVKLSTWSKCNKFVFCSIYPGAKDKILIGWKFSWLLIVFTEVKSANILLAFC